MKICLVLPYDISLTGGVTNHVVNFAIELQEKGQDVTILTTSSKNDFLIKNNILFIYSLHMMSNFSAELSNCSNIKLISNDMFPLFDN